jgi:hypothetical protein
MREICLPCPVMPENETEMIEIKMSGTNRICRYRIEPLLINDLEFKQNNTDLRIKKLKELIQNYDEHWELIQIFNTNVGSDYVHMLYREKYTETSI